MNRNVDQRPNHLTRADLRGVGASLRKIYTIADDGSFERLLRRLDRAAGTNGGSGS